MKTLAVILLVLMAGLGFLGYWFYGMVLDSLEPVDPVASEAVTFRVEPGASTSEVASALAEEDLVRDGRVFALYARYRGYDGRIQSGTYHLTPAMTPDEILEYLVDGRVSERSFTVPEGLNVGQTLRVLEGQGMGTREELEAAASRVEWVADWLPADYDGDSPLEGYLHPNTYRIPWDADAADVIARMVGGFREYWDEERAGRAETLGMTVHEVVTLASIVEREAVAEEERAVVSGVFHNRMEIGMRLEACATVHYAIGRPGGELSNADLETESPYNTYRVGGLPPGPIASPGAASLDAALYPESVPYLYFVAKDDGTHAFAETFAEHEANIRRYR